MAFTHGKKTAVFYGPYDWSPAFREVSTSASSNPIDVTTFADAGANNLKAYGAGLRDGTVTLGGLWSGTLDLDPDQGAARTIAAPDVLVKTWNDAGTEQPVTVVKTTTANTLAPNGYLVPDNTPAQILNALVQSWDTTAPVDDVVSLDVELMGTKSTDNDIGSIPVLAKTICHNYCDGTTGDTVSTPFVWSAVGTAANSAWVQVNAANNHDYGAVICVHVLDNTVPSAITLDVQIQHGEDGATGVEFGTNLLWTALSFDTVDSKIVAFNPGTGGTDGYWRISVTPSGSTTGELSIIASVAILTSELFT